MSEYIEAEYRIRVSGTKERCSISFMPQSVFFDGKPSHPDLMQWLEWTGTKQQVFQEAALRLLDTIGKKITFVEVPK